MFNRKKSGWTWEKFLDSVYTARNGFLKAGFKAIKHRFKFLLIANIVGIIN